MNKRTLLKALSALFFLVTLTVSTTSCVEDSEEKEVETNTLVTETYISGGQLTTDEWNQIYVDLNTCKINVNACGDSASLVDSVELSLKFLDAYYNLHIGETVDGVTLLTGSDFKTICDNLDDNTKSTYEYKCLVISRDILYYFNKRMKVFTETTTNGIIKTLYEAYPDYMLPYEGYEYAELIASMYNTTDSISN